MERTGLSRAKRRTGFFMPVRVPGNGVTPRPAVVPVSMDPVPMILVPGIPGKEPPVPDRPVPVIRQPVFRVQGFRVPRLRADVSVLAAFSRQQARFRETFPIAVNPYFEDRVGRKVRDDEPGHRPGRVLLSRVNPALEDGSVHGQVDTLYVVVQNILGRMQHLDSKASPLLFPGKSDLRGRVCENQSPQ